MNLTSSLNLLEGVWESVNLNPTVMIIRHHSGALRLLIFHIDEYIRQTHPAVFDIEEDEDGLYAGSSVNLHRLEYDPISDTLSISRLGDYLRN